MENEATKHVFLVENPFADPFNYQFQEGDKVFLPERKLSGEIDKVIIGVGPTKYPWVCIIKLRRKDEKDEDLYVFAKLEELRPAKNLVN